MTPDQRFCNLPAAHAGPCEPVSPIPRGEHEQLWHPCPPHVVWPFRCTQRHAVVGRCRRGRWHEGDHWARDLFWEQPGLTERAS